MYDDPYDIPFELIAYLQAYSTGTTLPLISKSLLAYIKRIIYKSSMRRSRLFRANQRISGLHPELSEKIKNRGLVSAREKRFRRAKGLGTILTAM